jgi:hypothetical protein
MNELETMARALLAQEKILGHSLADCDKCLRSSIGQQHGWPADECAPMQRWRAELAAGRELAGEVLA